MAPAMNPCFSTNFSLQIEQKSGARVRVVATPPNPASNGTFEEEKDGVVVIQGHRENVLTAELAVRKVIAQTAPVLTEDVFAPKESIGFIIGVLAQFELETLSSNTSLLQAKRAKAFESCPTSAAPK